MRSQTLPCRLAEPALWQPGPTRLPPSPRKRRLVLGGLLLEERLVDVGDDTAARDGGLDQGVELLVTADRELQVTRRDALHAQVLGRVAGKLEDLGGQVLQDGGGVDSSGGADAALGSDTHLEVAVDTADGELQAGFGRARDR